MSEHEHAITFTGPAMGVGVLAQHLRAEGLTVTWQPPAATSPAADKVRVVMRCLGSGHALASGLERFESSRFASVSTVSVDLA